MNGDGVINENDVNPFVLALTNRAEFDMQSETVDADFVGDFNDSGSLELGDLAGFRASLSSGTIAEIPEPASAALGPARWETLDRSRSLARA